MRIGIIGAGMIGATLARRLKEALAVADRGRLAEYRGKADDAARAFFA
jgi:predicted dinucleotide-binding enzyme